MSNRALAPPALGHTAVTRRQSRLAIGALLITLTLLPAMVGAQQAPLRIAVVDLDLIVARSASGIALQAKLEAFQKQIQAESESMANAAREIRQQISDGANSLSEDRLSELQKQYEDNQIAIRRFRDDKQREGQKMQQEGLQTIELELEPVFKSLVDEGAWDIILNRVPGVVVSASERADITQQVLDRLNAGG